MIDFAYRLVVYLTAVLLLAPLSRTQTEGVSAAPSVAPTEDAYSWEAWWDLHQGPLLTRGPTGAPDRPAVTVEQRQEVERCFEQLKSMQ